MSDSHTRETAPSRHHAKLVVNSTKTIVDFLYDVLEYQKTRLERCMAKKSKLPYIRY